MKRLHEIFTKLHEVAESIYLPKSSKILSLNDAEQMTIYLEMLKIISKDVLAPLTLIYTYSNNPIFSQYFVSSNLSIGERLETLMNVLRKTLNPQSELSTDIRYMVLYYFSLSNKFYFQNQEQIDLLTQYPIMKHDNPKMQHARPFIRSTEGVVSSYEKTKDIEHNSLFWERISKMTDCDLYIIQFEEEKTHTSQYIKYLQDIFSYLNELYTKTSPLDNKMLVILGIATYSYKRIKEVSDYKLSNTIVGRSSVRVLIENYIMIKYLVVS